MDDPGGSLMDAALGEPVCWLLRVESVSLIPIVSGTPFFLSKGKLGAKATRQFRQVVLVHAGSRFDVVTGSPAYLHCAFGRLRQLRDFYCWDLAVTAFVGPRRRHKRLVRRGGLAGWQLGVLVAAVGLSLSGWRGIDS